MPSFNLTQLFMGIALLGILLTLVQSEGCGTRDTRIECISYNPEGTRLVVSRLDARDAQTPGKGYRSDIARTLSVYGAADGSAALILHHDFRPGNQGPAFGLWRGNRNSAACFSEGFVIVHEFGGGSLVRYSIDRNHEPRPLNSFPQQVLNLAMSPDGSLVAASNMDEVGIIETKTDSLFQRCQSAGLPFLGASQLTFSPDGTTLAVANERGLHLLAIAQDKELSEIVGFRDKWIDELHWADCDSLVIVSDRGIGQYDTFGKFIRSFALPLPVLACAVSQDGTLLAASTDSEVVVFEVSSGSRLQAHRIDFATSLAFAPHAKQLAIGHGRGSLTVLDIDSGQTMWTTTVAGRYRWPWTVPGAALLIWFYVVYRISKAEMARADAF